MPPKKRGRKRAKKAAPKVQAVGVTDDTVESTVEQFTLESPSPLESPPKTVPDQIEAETKSYQDEPKSEFQSTEIQLESQSHSGDNQPETESQSSQDQIGNEQLEAESVNNKSASSLVPQSVQLESQLYDVKQQDVSVHDDGKVSPLSGTIQAKQKSKGKKKANNKKVKTDGEKQAEEGTESEWAVSSCSDDSRKHVVLICRRRNDTEQQNEDVPVSDGHAVDGLVSSELPITASCNPSSSMEQETAELFEIEKSTNGEVNAQQANSNVPQAFETKNDAPTQTEIVQSEPIVEKSKPKRGVKNSRGKTNAPETTACIEQRVTRSGRKSARLQAKHDEPVLTSVSCDVEPSIDIPTLIETADGSGSTASVTTDSTELKSLTGSPSKKSSPIKSTASTSSLTEQIERASLVNVSVDIVLLSPKELDDIATCDNKKGSSPKFSPSSQNRELKVSSSSCRVLDLQDSPNPKIAKSSLNMPPSGKKKARRCFSDTIQNSYCEQTGAESSQSSILLGDDCSKSMCTVSANKDELPNLDSDKNDRFGNSSNNLSSNSDLGYQVMSAVLPISSIDGVTSKHVMHVGINLGESSLAEAENTSLLPVVSGSNVETDGSSRVMPDTDVEPLSDEEIPLKKRRIRTLFNTASEQIDEPSEHSVSAKPQSEISSDVLLERTSNIDIRNQTRTTIESTLSVVRPIRHCHKFVGGHVSITGNVSAALKAAHAIGSQAVGMFIKRQGTLFPDPLSSDEALEFKQLLKTCRIAPHLIVPHASYLLNCGSGVQSDLENSRRSLVDDLKRCQSLGLPLFNFHPGSFQGTMTADECIDLIAASINYAHSQVKDVITVIENMCGSVNTVGGKFLELRRIINRITDKSRIGVCLDTCHAFAAGYDLRTEVGRSKMMDEFTQIIGMKYLKAIHVNDSGDDVGSCKDHHAAIGKGKIGLDCFKWIMNEPLFDNLPIVLETPVANHKAEIELLYSFCR